MPIANMLNGVFLSIIILSVTLSAVMISVVLINAVMLGVLAPTNTLLILQYSWFI
jgi:hypothetical protein